MKKHIPGLTNKKGSVLFLVLAIMTILIIAASAAYYMVLSNRGSVEARRKDEQSYQTAISVNNGVSDYIDAYLSAVSKSSGSLDTTTNKLVKTILALPVGSSITTTKDGNLASLEDYGMGEYEVVITKMDKTLESNGDTVHTIKLETTADVDGRKVKLTQIKTITTGPSEYFTRFFTSTGKRPEDVRIESNEVLTDVYMENDYSVFGGGATKLNDNVYVTGTLVDEGMQYSDDKKEMIIGENFYVTSTAGNEVLKGGGTLMVGGNCMAGVVNSDGTTGLGKSIQAEEAYILGDLTLTQTQSKATTFNVQGDCYIHSSTLPATFYINGDLYLDKNVNGGQGTFYVGGDVYLAEDTWYSAAKICYSGEAYNIKTGAPLNFSAGPIASKNLTKEGATLKPWDPGSIDDVAATIAEKTAKQKYEDWNADEYFDTAYAGAPVIDNIDDIRHYDAVEGTLKPTSLYEITESCVLQPTDEWGGSWGNTIVIDATDEDIYIKLQPNPGETDFYFGGNGTNVLVKGQHSVVFVLPDNVNFTTPNQNLYVGHYEWAKLMTGMSDSALEAKLKAQESSFNLAGESKNYKDGIKTKLNKTADGTILDTSGTNGLHNNIFLVTNGSENKVDFGGGECCFWGYLYAPNTIFHINNSDQSLSFVGGMILGSYTYLNPTASLAFTTPYDYYDLYDLDNPTDIVKHLMGQANDTSYTDPTSTLKGWGTVGYIS